MLERTEDPAVLYADQLKTSAAVPGVFSRYVCDPASTADHCRTNPHYYIYIYNQNCSSYGSITALSISTAIAPAVLATTATTMWGGCIFHQVGSKERHLLNHLVWGGNPADETPY